MADLQWQYYQFKKKHGYPVFLRLKKSDVSPNILHVITEQGFEILSDVESKKIPIAKPTTRILTLQVAAGRSLSLIQTSDSLDKYGQESLSLYGGVPHYTYRQIGLMNLPLNKILWDFYCRGDLTTTEQLVGVRVILVRYLAHVLADQGVLFYWGTVKGQTVELMKQNQSMGEAVMIDLNKKIIVSPGSELQSMGQVKFHRKDKEFPNLTQLQREDFISYLSVSHCLLGFTGLTPAMKSAAYELGQKFSCYSGTLAAAANL
jgi:hypothetical protein